MLTNVQHGQARRRPLSLGSAIAAGAIIGAVAGSILAVLVLLPLAGAW